MPENPVFELPHQREPNSLRHHYDLGATWLRQSDSGRNTVPLIYAGFEFRLAIERLFFHYWYEVAGRPTPLRRHASQFAMVKDMRRTIQKIAGSQAEIDRLFAFGRALLGAMHVPFAPATPDVRRLERLWGECSEFCHLLSNVGSETMEIRALMYNFLSEVAADLEPLVASPAWPVMPPSLMDDLRRRYMAGQANDVDVAAFVEEHGCYAEIETRTSTGPRVEVYRRID